MLDRENEFFNEIQNDTMDEGVHSSSGMNYGEYREKSNIKNTIIAITAGAIFAGILVVIFSMNGKKTTPTNLAEIPTLTQPIEPIKISPDTIGNNNEVFDNASIYNNISNTMTNNSVEMEPIAQQPEIAPLPSLPKKINEPQVKSEPVKTEPIKKIEKAKKIEKVAPVKPITKKKDTPKPQTKKIIEKATNVEGEVEISVVQPQQKTTGTWNVQLTSTSSKEAAQKEWDNLKKKYPTILGNKSYTITNTQVNGKTYYRLRVSNLSSSDEATELCNQLKAYKLSCFVIK